MKSKTIGSSGKIRPVLPVFVHKEMLQRHSFDSFNDLSIGDVSGTLTTSNHHQQQQQQQTLRNNSIAILIYRTVSVVETKPTASNCPPPSSMASFCLRQLRV
jgi:hypothetical protein